MSEKDKAKEPVEKAAPKKKKGECQFCDSPGPAEQEFMGMKICKGCAMAINRSS